MKERYKRRIREFAEKSLESKLENAVKPHLSHIPSEIIDLIKQHVAKVPLPDDDALGPKDSMGLNLQYFGREIADQLLEGTVELVLPLIKEDVKKRKEGLAKMHLLADKSENALNILREKINRGQFRKSEYWRGADVIISPVRVENTSKTQVVTGTEDLSGFLSWLFIQLRDHLSPFIDFRNKYRFYGELAETANNTLLSDNHEDINKDVLLSVLSLADQFRKEMLPGLNDYFNAESICLSETEDWLATFVK